ncbi:DNA-primase RepB domain-containing protein [Nitrosomonas sp.]|uniref:DNA-primase RepB domain-containing protein n=1 Tax=Nitrosomonas sp. TaxID=42353 RepID=UPI0032F04ADC
MTEKEITVPPFSELESNPEALTIATAPLKIPNCEFIDAVFHGIPRNAFAAVCSKPGNPEEGGWLALKVTSQLAHLCDENNNYLNCSSFYHTEDGNLFNVRKEQFAACHFLMLDDIGTKVPLERFAGFEFSWLVETSPGNHQAGIILTDPITNSLEAEVLLKALISAELCDPGSSGICRWARLPVGINGKTKYLDSNGNPFHCRLIEWNLDKRYTPQELIDKLSLKYIEPAHSRVSEESLQPDRLSNVLIPKSKENPVITALKLRGLYKNPLRSGNHDVTCPWVHEHTDQLDGGAAYFEPSEEYPIGGFCCQHSHREKFHIRELIDFLGITESDAQNKPVIRIVSGDLHRIIDAAENVLTIKGGYFQSGGLIVTITIDPITGDASVVPSSTQSLTKELSVAAAWVKYDGRSKSWIPSDPPQRHVAILYDSQSYKYLPPLRGVVRQPYFRETDSELVSQPGYDSVSRLFGVFDPNQFTIPIPTVEAAQSALVLLDDLISEFRFASDIDKSAALSAIFTAVTRPTLAYAPAFHGRAPTSSSGKTYLCELIGIFAGPAANAKVSYPTTSEEATKTILSLLLTNPAVIEFDDMDTDWIPHGTIKRMLTAEQITDRILGVSKTATVSTRTLFLGSGNNVGPVRDLLRRVLTINLDPRCATPATMTYRNSPIEKVRKNRGKYVSAVLTIIQAYRNAGTPRTDVPNIATYSGAWSEYCRHPLIWMGLPDPATSLINQITNDPDTQLLKALMSEWNHVFGSRSITVRKVIEQTINSHSQLMDAIRELPVLDRGEINPSKFGWFLKKNANRIVGNYKFVESTADGRKAWSLVFVSPNPPQPSVTMTAESTKPAEPENQL